MREHRNGIDTIELPCLERKWRRKVVLIKGNAGNVVGKPPYSVLVAIGAENLPFMAKHPRQMSDDARGAASPFQYLFAVSVLSHQSRQALGNFKADKPIKLPIERAV